MNRLYDKESERVMQAYSTGTEMGHCAYISYLEAELMKFRSPADLPEAGASAERICSVVRSLPDYNEIDQVANDEANGIDWDILRYSGIYTDGFIAGALWMKNKIKQ